MSAFAFARSPQPELQGATTSVPVRAVSTATSGLAAATIADTGPSMLEWQLASAIALILLGASLVGLARGSGATEHRDAERGGRKHS